MGDAATTWQSGGEVNLSCKDCTAWASETRGQISGLGGCAWVSRSASAGAGSVERHSRHASVRLGFDVGGLDHAFPAFVVALEIGGKFSR